MTHDPNSQHNLNSPQWGPQGEDPSTTAAPPAQPPQEPASRQGMFYGIIGGLVLLVIALLIWMFVSMRNDDMTVTTEPITTAAATSTVVIEEQPTSADAPTSAAATPTADATTAATQAAVDITAPPAATAAATEFQEWFLRANNAASWADLPEPLTEFGQSVTGVTQDDDELEIRTTLRDDDGPNERLAEQALQAIIAQIRATPTEQLPQALVTVFDEIDILAADGDDIADSDIF